MANSCLRESVLLLASSDKTMVESAAAFSCFVLRRMSRRLVAPPVLIDIVIQDARQEYESTDKRNHLHAEGSRIDTVGMDLHPAKIELEDGQASQHRSKVWWEVHAGCPSCLRDNLKRSHHPKNKFPRSLQTAYKCPSTLPRRQENDSKENDGYAGHHTEQYTKRTKQPGSAFSARALLARTIRI